MAATKIEWADKVWNPVVGCSKVSPGCRHCYAEWMSYRLACMGQKKYQAVVRGKGKSRPGGPLAGRWNGKIYLDEAALDEPRHWRKPCRVFLGSMTDIFHPRVPFDFLERIWDVIWACKQHTFIVLTKRPARMVKFVCERAHRRAFGWTDLCRPALAPGDYAAFTDIRMRDQCGWVGDTETKDHVCDCPQNESAGHDGSCDETSCPVADTADDRESLREIGVEAEFEFDREGFTVDRSGWMKFHTRPRHGFAGNVQFGVTFENQDCYLRRIRDFRGMRWHCPPETVLFASVEPMLGPIDFAVPYERPGDGPAWNPLTGREKFQSGETIVRRPYLDGVILGGETGPGARPLRPDWARGVRDQCRAAGVPFFFKQWGEFHPTGKVGDKETIVCRETGESALWNARAAGWHQTCRGEHQVMHRVGRKRAGRLLDGRLHDELPGLKGEAKA